MRKLVLFVGAAVILAVSCSKSEQKENTDSLQIAQLSEELSQATDYKDSLLLLMDDIYQGMDQINQQENLLNNMGASASEADRREAIRQNLENIRQKLQSNRELLSTMENRLSKQKDENGVLLKTINNLKSQIASQETKIAQLNTDLENALRENAELKTQVAETQEQVRVESEGREQAQQQATAATNELNRCYYAVGTNAELKSKNLISKKFLSSTKVMEKDFDATYFTTSDKRSLTLIPTGDKKVKIWTNHPTGSYQIIENANGTKSVKITDPARFWSLSNHLIIQIK